MISETFNEDCLIGMARYPDKFFDLAMVDPPYGIKESAHRNISRQKLAKTKNYKKEFWDFGIPSAEYFSELKRISKNQIIWGGNYFLDFLGATRCFIVWDKVNGDNCFADCELAWTSFDSSVRKIEIRWNGMLQHDMSNKEERMHPTQKPIKLYYWLLQNYAKTCDKILDTHLGSGSSRIAAYKLGFDFWGWELDKDYFEAQERRFKAAINEPLFQTKPEPVQSTLRFT